MALKALIFDVDGTLAETERDGHRIAFNQAFAKTGLIWNWSVELYGELLEVPGGKERIRFYLDQYKPEFKPDRNIDEFITTLHHLKNQYYHDLLASGIIPLRPGVKRLIEAAKTAGLRLAIATTSALPNVMALLEKTLHPDWFEIIAAGDIVPAKKPAPDIYNYVLQKLDLPPENCLVFEDSHQGLQAATKAGLKTIITVNDYTQHQDFSDAVLVVNHLGEVDKPLTCISGKLEGVNYLDIPQLQTL
ncbi:HAD family hydrolase [Limnoraphis robusta]|uniref:HAD family hydrolase n=1 Tax=Limnoraphis robusta CCNP1315 TaxID=3110306 RepID=A0ABU5TV15_9CYAN|nr:HAD family hydrolase [Limnoraphis robusta]MEA5518547.1 HAD family hydrolase [Limnoraphis robusta CCNP1315]MEA5548618.1 HAD family hydrolase [Limnoraphis robusta CCNP1324]